MMVLAPLGVAFCTSLSPFSIRLACLERLCLKMVAPIIPVSLASLRTIEEASGGAAHPALRFTRLGE